MTIARWIWLGVLALALCAPCTGLQVIIGQPANPLGRALKVCGVPELGYLQSANATPLGSWPGMGTPTSNGEFLEPVVFSEALGNLGQVKGFDVDFLNHVLQRTLAWSYEIHAYPSYAASFYHAITGKCDLVFGAFNRWPERVQCHAMPAVGESWGGSWLVVGRHMVGLQAMHS